VRPGGLCPSGNSSVLHRTVSLPRRGQGRRCVFKAYPEFLFQWLEALGVKLTQRAEPEISFQEFFRSENGEQGIYDLFIRLRNGEGDHLIVIESKIDSTAMPGQLEKYEKDLVHR
jgi:hypothetical protein